VLLFLTNLNYKELQLLVSVIAPCFNEAQFIESFVRNVFLQEIGDFSIELLVADGISDDGTRQILNSLTERYASLKLIDNPKKIVSSGLNKAILEATGSIIIRMDVHTSYAPDYLLQCVAGLKDGGTDCVGGSWNVHVSKDNIVSRSIALAFKSRIGSGNASSRQKEFTGPVDSVYLGAWRKDTLISIGMFDENLVRNQDDELCLRLRLSGKKVWQLAKIKSVYYPRTTLRKLFLQWFQYGFWRPVVIKKHSVPGAFRQLIPSAFVISIVIGFVWFLAVKSAWPLLILLSVYALLVIFSNKLQFPKENIGIVGVMTIAVFLIHISYGIGFIWGLAQSQLNGDKLLKDRNKVSR
jgi:succinoglycan biosynthesis protein ExoA